MADFKNDFKKDKHLFYLQNEPCHSICENVYAEDGNGNKIVDDKGCWIKTGRRISEYYKRAKPNMFLFAVPEQLVDSVGAYLVTNYPHYGLLGVNSNQSHSGQINFPVRSVIRPKKLHSEKLHPTIKETIVARMASEIANLRLRTLNEIKN